MTTLLMGRLILQYRPLYTPLRGASEMQAIPLHKPLHPMFSATIFDKVGLNVIHMPTATDGSKYILGIQDDLIGWADYKSLRKASS